MEKDEGQELLLHSSRADEADIGVIEDILARLKYLLLAIDQVRAYIWKQQLLTSGGFRERAKGRRRIF